MKRTKKLLSLLMALVLLVTSIAGFSITAFAADKYGYYENDEDGVYIDYMYNKDGATLSYYYSSNNVKDIVLPSKVDGKKVIAIDMGVSNELKGKLVIPDSVEKIKYLYVNANTVVIGKGVNTIKSKYNPSVINGDIKAFEVSSKNKYFTAVNGVLFNKKKTTLVKYPSQKANSKYTVPKSVATIGNHAFATAYKLKELTIPASVTKIEDGQFNHAPLLKKITVDGKNKKFASKSGVLFNKDKTTLVKYPVAKKGDKYTVPSSVKTIADHAFVSNEALKTVTLGKNVTTIGSAAFSGCYNLSKVNMSSKLKTLGDNVFYSTALTSVALPKTVTTMGYGTFQFCSKLKKADLSKTAIKKIPSGTFMGTSITSCSFPKELKTIEPCAYSNTKVKSVKIPSTVTNLGYDSFSYCKKLKTVEVPSSIKKIEMYTFEECTSLETLTIKGKDTSIVGSALSCWTTKPIVNEDNEIVDYEYVSSTPKNLTIVAPKGSKAQKFATKNHIKFKKLS